MYDDFYSAGNRINSGVDFTWIIISLVLAIVGGIVAYTLFVSKKNDGEYTGILADLHDFLNFKKYFIEVILKVMYLITAIFITLGSFSLIGTSVAGFFLTLIVGNVIARIVYELILIMLTIVNNVTEINQKLTGSVKKEEPKIKKKAITEKKVEKEKE